MNIDTKVETTIDQSSTFKQSLEIKILGEFFLQPLTKQCIYISNHQWLLKSLAEKMMRNFTINGSG